MNLRPKCVTARICGGLGNQLFIYSAARRLALVNNAELRIDHISGFQWDRFARKYALHNFNIPHNLVQQNDPFVSNRIYRIFSRECSRFLPFSWRLCLTEKGKNFDERLVKLKLRGNVYLEGYWQSEGYFQDVQQQIRGDLRPLSEPGPETLAIRWHIESVNAVGLHVRRQQIAHPVNVEYYDRAIQYMLAHIDYPHFIVFSDCPGWAEKNLRFTSPVTYVTPNNKNDDGCTDLWLMSLCKHFVIANSTFSWWGAWLSNNPGKIVTSPSFFDNWGHVGLLPDGWVTL
jgi:hypothetical protein